MAADYLLRMIEQLAAAVASILAAKNRGDLPRAAREIEERCLEATGLPLVLVKQSPPDALVELLATAGPLRHVRGVTLAELLLLDASLAEGRGNPPEAANSHRLARRLLLESLDAFGAEERRRFDGHLATIEAKLRDLGGG